MKIKILWGFIFAGIFLFLAFRAAGYGHGSYIFFSVAMPYGLGLLIYPMLFALTEYLYSVTFKMFFLLTALVHYSVTAIFVILWWNDDFPYLIKTWSVSPTSILFPLLWYLMGQVFIWILFFKNINLKEIK
ncbi:MAG TPA: hypothetical protein VIK89_13610 [Cytophagaceae bacterium]|jgi:hypothetical protein